VALVNINMGVIIHDFSKNEQKVVSTEGKFGEEEVFEELEQKLNEV
ncbi:MAG: hypothetical protein ISS94_06125, partial [Candidatus Syntrophoarchaeum sp.]|nr:hypothetical protein [Candidatus Syntrophoarchaeum sp.]